MTDLWRLPATDIAAKVRAKQVSAAEVARAALARCAAVNPRINAVIAQDEGETLAAAAAVDAAIARGEDPGPMAGVPVTIKVNADQQGWATTNGLRIQEKLVAEHDNPVVANLRRAGAVILGRTNTPAFSLRWFTKNSLHGHTLNPRDPKLTPGGSSGGAAAAVVAGIGAVAHGTDIAGSIRYPAYACGIHGLRPTMGRVPAWNASAPERGAGGQLMAVSGPLARTVADVELAFRAMAAKDVRDPWWTPAPFEGPAMPKRAAFCLAPEGMAVQPAVAAAVQDAARRLKDAGWTVEEVATPPLKEAADLNFLLWLAEVPRGPGDAPAREGDADALKLLGYMDQVAPPLTLDSFKAAITRRNTLLREWSLFLDKYAVALMPVSGELPFEDQTDVRSFEDYKRILAAQLPQVGLPFLGLPGLTVSTGLVGTAPVGVQVVAARFREDLALAAGRVIEAAGAPPMPVDPA